MPMSTYTPSTMMPGRSVLDTPPPTPPDRIKPSLAEDGDDTASLLGAMGTEPEGTGVSASSPTGRALQGVMMVMAGINEVESVVPGAFPPQIVMIVQKLSMDIPEIVRNMQMSPMTGPNGLMTGVLGMNGGPGAGMNPGQPPPMGGGMGMGAGAGAGMPPGPMAPPPPQPQEDPMAMMMGRRPVMR